MFNYFEVGKLQKVIHLLYFRDTEVCVLSKLGPKWGSYKAEIGTQKMSGGTTILQKMYRKRIYF